MPELGRKRLFVAVVAVVADVAVVAVVSEEKILCVKKSYVHLRNFAIMLLLFASLL